MTDNPPIAADAAMLANLSPEAVASAKLSYVKAGYSLEAIGAAFSSKPGKGPEIKSSTFVATPNPANDGLTPEQREAGFKVLLERGTIDRDTVLRAAKKAGVEFTDAPSAETIEAQTGAAMEGAFAPPSTPEGYDIRLPEYAADVDPSDAAALMSEVRSGFHAAGVPGSMADGLAQALFDSSVKYPPDMSEAATKLRFAEEGARIRKLSGAGGYEEVSRLAELAIAALPEQLRTMLYENHSFHTAEAFNALAGFGRVLEARSKKL